MEKSSTSSFFTAAATSFLAGLLTGLATLAPSLLRMGEALTVRPNSSLVDSFPCQVLRTGAGAGVSGSCLAALAGLPDRGRVPYIELACLGLSPPPPPPDRLLTPGVLLLVLESSIASRLLPPVL